MLKVKELAEARLKANQNLYTAKVRMWQALTAGSPLASTPAKSITLKDIAQAAEQLQANMARLRALEASSAVSHRLCLMTLLSALSACSIGGRGVPAVVR